jgi:hypothetical protein
MKKYLLEAISGDGSPGLEFQLDCKPTEGNLQHLYETKPRDCKIQGVSDNIHVRENRNINILWCRRD